MDAKQKEIVLLPYPFSDLEGTKVRPAIIVSNDSFNNKSADCIMVPLTTVIKDEPYSIVINQQDLTSGKLLKPSRIRADKIFAAEKKLFAQTAFLVIPILLFWEASASIKIFSSVKPKVFWAVAAMLIILGIFPYYRTFYTRPLTHKSSESYFYREIARWISKNEDKNVVVTTLFGPTEKMTKYYLGEVPSNVSFQNFDLIKEGASENTYYVGLPGQFVKKGMDLEEKEKTESRVQIIDKIIGEGELVFEYGENLWIGYQK